MAVCPIHGCYYAEEFGSCSECKEQAAQNQRNLARMAQAAEDAARRGLSAPSGPAMGLCRCCGQRFDDSVRVRTQLGKEWCGILGDYKSDGVCPRCYHERLDRHEERDWTVEEWRSFFLGEVERGASAAVLRDIVRQTKQRYPDIAEAAERKCLRLEQEETERAQKRQAEEAARHAEQERLKRAKELQSAKNLVEGNGDIDKIIAQLPSIGRLSEELVVSALGTIVGRANKWRQIDAVLEHIERLAPNLAPQAQQRIRELRECEEEGRKLAERERLAQERVESSKRIAKGIGKSMLWAPLAAVACMIPGAIVGLIAAIFVGWNAFYVCAVIGGAVGVIVGVAAGFDETPPDSDSY